MNISVHICLYKDASLISFVLITIMKCPFLIISMYMCVRRTEPGNWNIDIH